MFEEKNNRRRKRWKNGTEDKARMEEDGIDEGERKK